MQLTESSQSATVTVEPGISGGNEIIQQCDECGAPVDKDQRYCVACGAHRRHVNDPAARYLSQATARSRSKKAGAAARKEPGAGARVRGLGLALAIALIPVAAAAGVTAGRSSNNGDAKLIRALAQHQFATGVTTTIPASTARGSSTAAKKVARAKAERSGKSASAKPPSTKHAGKVLSTTKNGTAQQITGFKPTQAQKQQGQSAAQKVQKSTGKSYVTGQNNLPSQVVVP